MIRTMDDRPAVSTVCRAFKLISFHLIAHLILNAYTLL